MSKCIVQKPVLGLDIGGANLKAAHTGGFTRHVPFALWKNPAGLADALRTIVEAAPPHDVLAVTMTGELCDCFESRCDGVEAILSAIVSIVTVPVQVWTTDGCFTGVESARTIPLKVASANWLALATFACRFAPVGSALLVDIGTTTTDIVPLVDGRPVALGRTDKERMETGELLYRGWRRTPVCSYVEDGAAEFFATFHDVYLVLKMVPEDTSDCDTPDGRPATRVAAQRRLARMIGADLATTTDQEIIKFASLLNTRLVSAIERRIDRVIKRLPEPPRTVISSGSGEFLLPMDYPWASGTNWSYCRTVWLSQCIGPVTSAAACAHAVAVLCSEREE
jgi:probable H4MPT-linked C1 transfer pathway protein